MTPYELSMYKKSVIANVLVFSILEKATNNLAVTRNVPNNKKTNILVSSINNNLSKKSI